MTTSGDHTRAWSRVALAAVALGVVSLLSNVQTEAQLTGQAPTSQAIRLAVSHVANSPTAWAGLLVLAGWLVARPRPAALAGPLAGLLALVTHYGLGEIGGHFTLTSGFGSNLSWFAAAAVLGVPLGLVGACARAPGRRGLAARLLVPVAAIAEPLATGTWFPNPALQRSEQVADVASAVVLTALGVVGTVLIWRGERRRAAA